METGTSPNGSIHSIIGPNGAGKTTFFNASPASTCRTRARSSSRATTSGPAPHEVTRLGISRTYQNIRLFGGLTAIATSWLACTRG